MIKMSSQAFLWTNIGIALIVVLLFLIGRKSVTSPSKLNLKKGSAPSSKSQGKAPVHYQSKNTDPVDANMKSLNVMFMYNGHNFDAYEVLGVPAGARMEMVQAAFDKAIALHGSDREFLEAALGAIKR